MAVPMERIMELAKEKLAKRYSLAACSEQEREAYVIADKQAKCDAFNASPGNLTDFDCPECQNRGYFQQLDDSGYTQLRPCKCMATRYSLRRLKKSGLEHIIDRCTFDSFDAKTEWQRKALEKAQQYAANPTGWFYAGGQVGAGKTHLCTAIVAEFLHKGYDVRYMMWRDEATEIKACINDHELYRDALEPLKTVRVLYIDDFLKTPQGIEPTKGDANLAFELLNYRYNDTSLITVISSERYMHELVQVDEALSRVFERAKENCIDISRGEGKNYRLR